MLHLQARIHLEEVELAVLGEELDGSGADVSHLLDQGDRGLAHLVAEFVGQARRR